MVTDLDTAMQERLAGVLETRGADRQQQAMRQVFLGDIPFPAQARVLEVGCGTGVLTRTLARWENVGEVVGVDPAQSLLEKARSLSSGVPNVFYQEADGRALPFEDESFDAVVFDSTLCHMPGPERGLAEAFRTLRGDGLVAVFDGDYATTTVALDDHDPLQVCVDAMMANSVNDRFLGRKLHALVRQSGFEIERSRGHSFVETSEGSYMLTVIDRGADILRSSGQVSDDAAAALKKEARRRVEAGTFFGHVAYVSLVARKPR